MVFLFEQARGVQTCGCRNMLICESFAGVFKFETLMVCESRGCASARDVCDIVGFVFLLKLHFQTSLLGPTCRARSTFTFL